MNMNFLSNRKLPYLSWKNKSNQEQKKDSHHLAHGFRMFSNFHNQDVLKKRPGSLLLCSLWRDFTLPETNLANIPENRQHANFGNDRDTVGGSLVHPQKKITCPPAHKMVHLATRKKDHLSTRNNWYEGGGGWGGWRTLQGNKWVGWVGTREPVGGMGGGCYKGTTYLLNGQGEKSLNFFPFFHLQLVLL